MLSVADAQEKVLAVAQRSTSIAKLDTAEALGFVIAEDIISDLDLPDGSGRDLMLEESLIFRNPKVLQKHLRNLG